jgi:hypothetical protein
MFALIKRVGVKDEYLASSFFSILLTTTTITLSFPLKFIFQKGFVGPYQYDLLIKIILCSVLVIWYFICKIYFLKKEKYISIIAYNEKKYVGKNKQMAILGILYSLFTFISFISLAFWISRL